MSDDDLFHPTHHIDMMFKLSYASYLVLPRTLLQSMPVEWQAKFTELVRQLNEARTQAGIEQPAKYWVRAVDKRGRFQRETLPHYRHEPNVLERST